MKKNIFCFVLTILLTVTAVHAQDNWNNQNPATIPASGAMAFIVDDKVLIFGGGTQTWIYDLSDNNWTPRSPVNNPPARQYHEMAWLGDDKVLLFGGFDENFINLNDTWVYDLSDNTWTQKFPGTNPSARSGHGMAKIGDDQVLLFGGDGDDGGTWAYDLSDNNWISKSPPVPPPHHDQCPLANVGADKVLLFGSDTWVYDLSDNAWTLMSPATAPPGRGNYGMASIGGDKALLFGGTPL